MFQKLSKHKIHVAVISTALILAIGMGATFAWWVFRSDPVISGVTLGNMNLVGDFSRIDDLFYQPSDTPFSLGSVTNTGTVSAFFRIEFAGEILYKYADDDKNLAQGSAWEPVDPGMISVGFSKEYDPNLDAGRYSEDFPGWKIITDDVNGELVAAIFHRNSNMDDKYILLAPDRTIEFYMDSALSEKMTNQYQDAQIHYTGIIDATQSKDGAILERYNGVILGDGDNDFSFDTYELAEGEAGREGYKVQAAQRASHASHVPAELVKKLNKFLGR